MTTSSGPHPVWVEDPAGLRFIRRDLLAATAGIAATFLAVAIGLGRGSLILDAILLGLTLALVAARQALVAGLVHFARQAGIVLIAEGIETEPERSMLKALGVELGQGFLLARPAPIDDDLLDALARSDREFGAA